MIELGLPKTSKIFLNKRSRQSYTILHVLSYTILFATDTQYKGQYASKLIQIASH